MLREPVHDIAVIGRNALLVALAVTDDIFLRQPILLAEIHTQLDRFLVNGRKIRGIGQTVLANLKANMRIVGAAAAMPAAHIPRQRLVGGNGAVLQLANESVDTDLTPAGSGGIPVIAVLIDAEQPIVGSDVAFQIRIVRAGTVYHDALWHNGLSCFVAVVVRENELVQVHFVSSLLLRSWSCSKTSFSFAGMGSPRCPAFSSIDTPSLDR